jgi:hypothetical protein
MTQLLRAVAFSWVCACAASCKSEPLDQDSASRAPASPQEFIAAFAEGVCGGLGRCCGQQGVAFDDAACRTDIAAAITPEIAESMSFRVDWDPAAALLCIQDYSNAVCGEREVSEGDAKRNCSLMFRGRIAVGEPCSNTSECHVEPGESAYCDGGFSDVCQVYRPPAHAQRSAVCRGTCAIELDGVCDGGSLSQNQADGAQDLPLCHTSDGLQCSPDPELGWSCQPLLAVGESCASSPAGCGEGVFCNVDTLRCQPQLLVGAGPCSNVGDACRSPAVCDYEADLCTNLKSNGEPCSASSNCQSGYCSAQGVCSRPQLPVTLCTDPVTLFAPHD